MARRGPSGSPPRLLHAVGVADDLRPVAGVEGGPQALLWFIGRHSTALRGRRGREARRDGRGCEEERGPHRCISSRQEMRRAAPPPPPMFTANGVFVPVAPVAMPLNTPLGRRTTTRPTVIWPVNFWPASESGGGVEHDRLVAELVDPAVAPPRSAVVGNVGHSMRCPATGRSRSSARPGVASVEVHDHRPSSPSRRSCSSSCAWSPAGEEFCTTCRSGIPVGDPCPCWRRGTAVRPMVGGASVAGSTRCGAQVAAVPLRRWEAVDEGELHAGLMTGLFRRRRGATPAASRGEAQAGRTPHVPLRSQP